MSYREKFYRQQLACPACGAHIQNQKCLSCQRQFTSVLDIIDLRWPQPEKGMDPEKEPLIGTLLAHYDELSFSDLVKLRFQYTAVPPEFADRYKHYQSTLYQRGRQMMQMFRQRLEEYYEVPDDYLALDLGCGVGASSAVLAKQFQWVIGIDPSLPDLILAQKYFSENNITNVILIQAFAQHIPLQTGIVSYAAALNVIEHLFEVKEAFTELHRILKNNGCFCGDSRNRFDLLFPEPHANLRWVGFWPRKLQPWYVRKFKNVSYTSAYLLSWFELQKNAGAVFGSTAKILTPFVSAYGQSHQLDKLVSFIEGVPLLNTILSIFFPSHLLIAHKSPQ